LFTDADEELFSASRPIIVNGITELTGRPDLQDRALVIGFAPIRDQERRDEETFWAEFEGALPAILAGLYGAVSSALKNFPGTKLKLSPRMADFARWAVAAEPALGGMGTFLAAYLANRQAASASSVSSDPVAAQVLELLKNQDPWHGTATRLLDVLNGRVDKGETPADWPRTPRALSTQLRRIAPQLREALGIDYSIPNRGKERLIRLSRLSTQGSVACDGSDVGTGMVRCVASRQKAGTGDDAVGSPPPGDQ
jgi:hypothetical protein